MINDDNYFLPYELISDETNDDSFINQYSGYIPNEKEEKEKDNNYNNIYVGTDIKEVVNNFKKSKTKPFKQQKNNNLIFNKARNNEKYKSRVYNEYFDVDNEDSETDSEDDILDNFPKITKNLTLKKSIEDLKTYIYCLMIGIIFIFIIFIISKL